MEKLQEMPEELTREVENKLHEKYTEEMNKEEADAEVRKVGFLNVPGCVLY